MVFLRQLLILQHGIHGISLNKCNLRSTLTFKVAFICFTMLKVIFDKRYLNFCPRFFGNVGKWFDLKIYDLTDLETNNCNTHNVQYFMKLNQPDNENWSVNSPRNMFPKKSCKRCTGESSPRRFYSQTCLLQAPCNS